ncbi:MAG: type II secretion system F family protein [Holosporaceae bacterium]|jgi:tight adherence protein B|nr:type II secretion system F family protein [Holosporaceae bacterium]
MIQIIDTIFLFTLAFFCYVVANIFLQKSRTASYFNGKIEKKINTLVKQQEDLSETSGGRVSTFSKMEDAEFESDLESPQNVADKIRSIIRKTGMTNMSVSHFVVICIISGLALTAVIVHFQFLNAIAGIPAGMCLGAFLVYSFLQSRVNKRKMAFLRLFPDAIDMMIRGVRAGLNIGRILKLVSLESKDPLAGEFRTISQKFDLGMKPEKVLLDAAEKIDIEEFRFLVVALVLQMENGGVLAEILQNLSGIIRKRFELDLKLKAMSAEARMSAIVISALPFVFAGIMAFVNPSHLKEFVTPGTGQTLFKVAITLFSLGTFMMIKATQIKV